ncbi:MAG: hypothetical protein IMF16_08330 [Proteobacteria bacterium]|nr:hypothetical protein [Pseudomonadota bacterium]
MRRVCMLVLLAVVVVAPACWAAPESVQLRLGGEAGQEARYRSTVTVAADVNVQIPGTGMAELSVSPRLEGRFTTIVRVLDSAPNGDLTLGAQVESFNIRFDAADLHAQLAIEGPGGASPELIHLPPLPITMVVSNRGRLLSLDGLDEFPIPPLPTAKDEPVDLAAIINTAIQQFAQPAFPEEPVSAGESWEWEITVDPRPMLEMLGLPVPPELSTRLSELEPMRCVSTLAGFETVDGVECARIEATSPWSRREPVGSGGDESVVLTEEGLVTAVTWFDYEGGCAVRETLEFRSLVTVDAAGATPMRVEVRADRETRLLP